MKDFEQACAKLGLLSLFFLQSALNIMEGLKEETIPLEKNFMPARISLLALSMANSLKLSLSITPITLILV